jgi:hypothetical protein
VAIGGVDGNRVAVEGVVVDEAVEIRGAAVDDVAARHSARSGGRMRLVLPFQRSAGLRQIERIEHVWKRRHQVHGVLNHERRRLVPGHHTGGKGEHLFQCRDVVACDVTELAEAGVLLIAGGHRPFGTNAASRG